jgi:hypothetical protein
MGDHVTHEVAAAAWRKSIRCGESATCVEISDQQDLIGVRNSTMPSTVLTISVEAFRDMISAIKRGELVA